MNSCKVHQTQRTQTSAVQPKTQKVLFFRFSKLRINLCKLKKKKFNAFHSTQSHTQKKTLLTKTADHVGAIMVLLAKWEQSGLDTAGEGCTGAES